MSTTLETAVTKYLSASCPARGTRKQYRTTLKKWAQWGGGVAIESLGRKEIREFLDWVYEHAVADEGTNPGRTANKTREHLRAVISWAWEQDLIESPPRFPKPRPQRDVAGRHYLTKAEINESVASLPGIVIDRLDVFPYFPGPNRTTEGGHVGTRRVPSGLYRGNHSC
jgi:hypothetical protein